jgi:N-acetylmuramic acid 6-phosphate etherase
MPRDPRRITEQANPRTGEIDTLETDAVLGLIVAEDAGVPEAVRATLPELTRACDLLLDVLRGGGRWFNLGAGTSGRMGVLDAAEIPPTFGLPPDRVQGVIAGGELAMTRAVEGVEDDGDAARRDLEARRLSASDALVALSASGGTSYVLGGIAHARKVGAATIGITCVPDSALARTVDIAVVAVVGPEAIAGSTRMKGGLAQKMILHALSTTVMVRLGRVRGNLMSELSPVNSKLRERAVRIVAELAGCSVARAQTALEGSGGSIDDAVARIAREALRS